jgi:hypothetical protein
VTALTAAHFAVLTVLENLPTDVVADAALVAWLLEMPEAEVTRLLDELVALGCLLSPIGPGAEGGQKRR